MLEVPSNPPRHSIRNPHALQLRHDLILVELLGQGWLSTFRVGAPAMAAVVDVPPARRLDVLLADHRPATVGAREQTRVGKLVLGVTVVLNAAQEFLGASELLLRDHR